MLHCRRAPRSTDAQRCAVGGCVVAPWGTVRASRGATHGAARGAPWGAAGSPHLRAANEPEHSTLVSHSASPKKKERAQRYTHACVVLMHHLDLVSCQCVSTTLTLPCSSFIECDMTLHTLARYARPSVFAFCNGRRSSNRSCLGAVCDWARSPAAFVVCPWRSSRLFFCFAHTCNSDETSE